MKKYSTDDFFINYEQPKADEETKNKFLKYLIITLIGFHLFNFLLLAFYFTHFNYSINDFQKQSVFIITSILMFLFAHFFSYKYNKQEDVKKVPNISDLILSPIVRIFPIYIIPVLAQGLGDPIDIISYKIGLAALLIFKTYIDVSLHLVEHQKENPKHKIKFQLSCKKCGYKLPPNTLRKICPNCSTANKSTYLEIPEGIVKEKIKTNSMIMITILIGLFIVIAILFLTLNLNKLTGLGHAIVFNTIYMLACVFVIITILSYLLIDNYKFLLKKEK